MLIMPKHYKLDTYDNSVKVIENITNYDNYKSVITRCIAYENEIILSEILNSRLLQEYKNKLIKDSKMKMFLINYSLEPKKNNNDFDTVNINLGIVVMIFHLFYIDYLIEYDELIKNGNLVYKDDRIIDKTKDIDYIIEHFEEVTGEPLLIYDDCVNAIERHMNEKISKEHKNILKHEIQKIQETMFYIRQEMSDMNNKMYESWCDFKFDRGYYSYDGYPIKEQISIWETFKAYYEIAQELDSESEFDEDDY